MILSESLIVEILWAIAKVVLPSIILSKLSYTIASFLESKAEVASSNNNILGFLIIALAIAILYFYPPDNYPPLFPTNLLYPLPTITLSSFLGSSIWLSVATFSNSSFSIKSLALAYSAAFFMSPSVAL